MLKHSQLRGAGGFGNVITHLLDLTVNWTIIFGFRYIFVIRNRSTLFIYNLTTPGLIHQTQPNMIWPMMSSFLLIVLRVNGDCLAGKCQRISLDVHRDAVQDSEFVGHVFHNSVTLNPIQCYTWCIQDCRCLSLNYKENNDQKYCELNEENHFTKKTSLKKSPGSRYYILRRDYGSEVM